MKKLILPAMLLAFIAGSPPEIEKIKINYDINKLLAGELQIFEFDYKPEGQVKKKRVIGVLLINAPPATVWKLLADWDSMSSYVPGLRHQKTVLVLKKGKNNLTEESLIESRLTAAAVFNICYTLHVKFNHDLLRQDWYFLTKEEIENYNKQYKDTGLGKSTFGIKNITGFEYIEPYGDGAKTIYYYAPVVEVSIPVPDFIERELAETSLSDFVLAVKNKAEAINTGKGSQL